MTSILVRYPMKRRRSPSPREVQEFRHAGKKPCKIEEEINTGFDFIRPRAVTDLSWTDLSLHAKAAEESLKMSERQTHLMESPAYREKARADHSKLKDLFAALKQEQRDREARAKMSAEERVRFDQQRRHR